MQHNNIISLGVSNATGAISAHLRVEIDSNGQAVIGGATNAFLGTNLQDVDGTVASDGAVGRNISAVQLKGCGLHYATADGAIAVGAEVDPVAAGKITTTAGSPCGRAVEAASADGDVIRVVFYN